MVYSSLKKKEFFEMGVHINKDSTAEAIAKVLCQNDLSPRESQRAIELTLDLIRQAELDLRQALSERLSLEANIPAEIIIFLANDDIAVADSVLRNSPILTENDLIYIIAGKDEAYWRVIAERTNISPKVADKLIGTGDVTTMLSLLINPDVIFSKDSLKKIIHVSVVEERLQQHILHRPEMDAGLAIDLYMCAGLALKEKIANRFPMEAAAIEESLDNLLVEFARTAAGLHEPTKEMIALARRFQDREEISSDLLIRALRRGQTGFFVALFALKVGLPVQAALRLVLKESGHPFALACRSIGLTKAEFASLFMLASAMRGQRTTTADVLANTIAYYEALKEIDVQRVLSSWVRNPSLI